MKVAQKASKLPVFRKIYFMNGRKTFQKMMRIMMMITKITEITQKNNYHVDDRENQLLCGKAKRLELMDQMVL